MVGSRAGLEALAQAMTLHGLKPVIGATFELEQAAEAFRYMEAGSHVGKIVITL